MFKDFKLILDINIRRESVFTSYRIVLWNGTKTYTIWCEHGLKQLVQCPTWVTRSTSTLIDYIFASFPSRVSQKVVINVGLLDHQLIFCKIGGVRKYKNFRSLKNSFKKFFLPIFIILFGGLNVFSMLQQAFVESLWKLTSISSKNITAVLNLTDFTQSFNVEMFKPGYLGFLQKKVDH